MRSFDLVPDRSGAATQWLKARNQTFRDGSGVCPLGPCHGYKHVIDDQLGDGVGVLDAFHIVECDTAADDEVHRRVERQIYGH